MIELTVHVQLEEGLSAKAAAKISEQMSQRNARITLKSKNKTVNAKSILGLVSLGIRKGMDVTVLVDGPDEALAAVEMSRMLGC